MVYDRDKIGLAISFSFDNLIKKSFASIEPQMKSFATKIAKGESSKNRVRVGEGNGDRHGTGALVVMARLHSPLVSGGNTIWEPGLLKSLKLPKKRALVGLRLCNRQPQLNALLPSGSVYFLNINSGDRFKACLEIKHIIM